MALLPPVWLYTGPEIGERNTAIEQLKTQATRSGAVEQHLFYASDIRIGDLVGLLQNGSLFSDTRFVVVRNAEVIKKKEDVDLLSAWIASSASSGQSDSVYLVLVSDETSIDKKLETCVPKEHRKIFWEMFENRKEQWITDFFKKAGYSIEGEAVSSILELVENNTDALRMACSSCTLFFPKGHRITSDEIYDYISHTREETPFSVFDSLVDDHLDAALEIIDTLSLSKDSSPVQIIAGLTWCFRKLDDWHRLEDPGTLDEFSLKKAGFSGKRVIEQYRKASKRWNARETTRILALLAATDCAIRSDGTALANTHLQLCMYSIVQKKGEPVRSYTVYA